MFIDATVGSSSRPFARIRNAVVFLMTVLHRCVPVVKGYDASYMDGFAFYSLDEFVSDGSGGDVTSKHKEEDLFEMGENNRLLLEWKHTFTAVDLNHAARLTRRIVGGES